MCKFELKNVLKMDFTKILKYPIFFHSNFLLRHEIASKIAFAYYYHHQFLKNAYFDLPVFFPFISAVVAALRTIASLRPFALLE